MAISAHVLVGLVGASSADNLNIFDPVSPPANSIRDLFYLVLLITGIIFVLVEGMLLYCIIRFRKRPGDSREPPQIYGSQPIELAWTLAPLLIVFILFLIVVRYDVAIRRDQVPSDAVRVKVVGHQWWWEYQYPDLGERFPELGQKGIQSVTTANELHVPVNKPVFLELQSVDVVHSFWVPRLAGKTDVIPGHPNLMWFQALEPGLFHGQCAEFCGTQHANMILRVVVESDAEFLAWAEHEAERAAQDSRVKEGEARFLGMSCVTCHQVRGTSAVGTFGPELTHLMTRQTLASGMVPNDLDMLTQWVRDPQTIKPGCQMPSFHLNDTDVALIVEYLRSLK
jgi:cytochrome c oxidase subunit 2